MLVKAFRLFVSSTFVDFAQERELLQAKVFPALDAYCAAKGYQFLPLDMRWGINEEAHLDQRTADICLGEVHAAKGYPAPNFLIMIGNRYGWVPLPFAIAGDEFEAMVAWLEGHNQREAAGALGTLYQRDDNHLVPRGLSPVEPDGSLLISAYTLRSREDEVPELKPAEAWARLEAQLRRALQEAADQLLKLGQINAATHEKYFLSVTEQEIIHGLSSYSLRPPSGKNPPEAIAFIREIVGNVSGTPGPTRRSITFLRTLLGYSSNRLQPLPGYVEHEPRLDALKSEIRRELPNDRIFTAKAAYDEGGRLDPAYLAGFASAMQRKLEVAIDRHIALVSAIELAPDFALQSERAEHRAFAEQKRKIFAGRENNLRTIARYIAGRDDHPLILHGGSGLGKSALMARAIGDAEEAGDAPVIYRFIGASAASSDFRSLLVSLGGGEVMELALGGVPIGGILALAVLAGGRLISGWDSLIRQWDLKRGAEAASPLSHQDLVRALAVLPDGRLASGSADSTIRLWDVKTGAETTLLAGHGSSVNGLAVLSDGRLASGSSDHTIRLWDLNAGTENSGAVGEGDPVTALAVLPDGRLASGSGSQWGGTIRLWDVMSGAEIAQLKASGSGLNTLAVLPDGRLASGSGGRIIELWDLNRGASTGNLQFHEDGVNAMAMLPDGRLASGSRDRTIRIWDVTTGAETARFTGHRSSIVALAMLADGRLASGADDGTIRLWHIKTGTETGCLEVHGSSIIALQVLFDGRLVSGSNDGTIRLWDVKAGVVTNQLMGHRSSITALAVLADGRLVSGADDRTIRLWDAECATETTRLEVDASVSSVIALPAGGLVAGDRLGRLHWLEIDD
jgi:WD40 repeat protein